MLLTDFLSEELVRIGLTSTTKDEAIVELVDLLVETKKLDPTIREIALKAVMDRERSLSTGMEHGIALPHGSIDPIDDVLCAFGVSKEGIDFVSLDGKPAHLIILLVIPRKKFSKHVRTLAGIARLLNHAPMRERLLAAADPAEVMRVIHAEESEGASGEA